MKKLILMLLLGILPALAFSQQPVVYPSYNHRVTTGDFLEHWFVQAGADWNAFYSDQEHGAQTQVNKSPFASGRSLVGLNLALGKWITPSFGLRFKVSGARAVQVGMLRTDGSLVPSETATYGRWDYELQPMLNLTNLFAGYAERLWDITLYGGMGIARNYQSNPHGSTWTASLGLLNSFHLSQRVQLHVDISASAAEAGTDGLARPLASSMFKNRDCAVRFGLGVSVSLGKSTWQKAPDIEAVMDLNQAEIDALNATLMDAEMENELLRQELEEFSSKP